ncbi:MAG: peptidoglycan-associated lipoprotein Pal [Desulfobacterales bacterium]
MQHSHQSNGIPSRLWVILLVSLALALTLGCGKKKIASGLEGQEGLTGGADQQGYGTEEELGAGRQGMIDEEALLDQSAAAGGSAMTPEEEAMARFINEVVYFDYDSAVLSPAAQEILRDKAGWMRDNPNARVIIEGHTDSRGTGEYNLALGDRRAASARNFLTGAGIDGARVSTISYGEERPADAMENESAWAKNRRAEFVIER